ncbi:MAG: hypothetical protein HY808_11380 [Nitrospirae bacterium]|nr:hypothetical protein [Nitrospirota bacterium]
MIIRNKKMFSVGVVFAISFLAVLALIFSPVFNGKNGLVFSDDMFNKLSKGSSYFIPKVAKSVEPLAGKPLAVTIKLEKAEDVENTSKLFTTAGANVEANDTTLKINGDLGAILQSALADSDSMYKNDGKTVSERYGYDEKTVMKNWWAALNKIGKELKKEKLIAEAKVVDDVTKKAVEPGYNFYKIDANKVADHAGMMSGLLIFYVAYTMWWGYAIFYMFDGLGLSMKKAKVKKEA